MHSLWHVIVSPVQLVLDTTMRHCLKQQLVRSGSSGKSDCVTTDMGVCAKNLLAGACNLCEEL